MVRSRDAREQFLFVYEKEVEETLNGIFKSKIPEAIKVADQVVDFLTKMGFERFRFLKGQHPEKEN